MVVTDVRIEPFAVPLKEPFVISRASVTSTRAALVTVVGSLDGQSATGLGEAALPLGSEETVPEMIAMLDGASHRIVGASVSDLRSATVAVDAAELLSHTLRAGVFSAVVDAAANLAKRPLFDWLGGERALPLTTDITLPIADATRLAELAKSYWARGFRCFKIKVGKRLVDDVQTVHRVAEAVAGASVLFDANEGYRPDEALELIAETHRCGLPIACFEQPCPRDDLAGLRRVRQEGGVPVIADESIRDVSDFERLVAAEAVDGINLKLIKMGGIDRCIRLGKLAKEHGMMLMVGAMIESRLGLTAMAHVACVLGGVDLVDLDTAFLLARDPFTGGMLANGATLTLASSPGLGMTLTPQI